MRTPTSYSKLSLTAFSHKKAQKAQTIFKKAFCAFLWLISVEDEGEGVAFGGPTAIRVRDGKVYCSGAFFFPDCARDLLAVKQVMLDAGEDAAPVTTIDRFVNDAAHFYINPVATQNPVIDPAKQIQKPALLPLRGVAVWLPTISPCLRFVLRHGRSLSHRLRRLH